ncbi:ribonuclease H-like domain-containing protein, partial [Tanacetum coccineum]
RIVLAQPSAQQLMTHGLTPNQQALFTNAVQNTGNTSSNTGQETVLPIAFNTMTLQDPVNANWHMDTGASSHLNSSAQNQFKTDIKSLQCDHGGEFDNNALHQLFASNGITIRFSCPKTSQQNGKSERMIRTINNLIRTLLFQAHLPPTF